MVILLTAALFAAQMGKSAAGRGESLTKSNMEWHKNYNKEKEQEIVQKWKDIRICS